MYPATTPPFLRLLSALNTLTITLIAGAALSIYFFSMPLILCVSPITTTRSILWQFHKQITLGGRYLQQGSRIWALTLSVQIYLLYTHPDPEVARRWKWCTAALVTGAQVSWYEVVFIFPTNDKLVEMRRELDEVWDAGKGKDLDRKMRPEVERMLGSWLFWHIGRIVTPLVCSLLMLYGMMI